MRHQRRHADRRAGAHLRGRPRRARRRPGCAAGDLGHPHPQRRRAGRGQLARRGAGRGAPRAGHHQRLRRALRQRQHGQRHGQPGAQDGPAAAARGWRRHQRPDVAVAARGGDRQQSRRSTTSRSWAAPPSRTRAASTAPRWPRSSAATSTSDPMLVGNSSRLVVSELGGRANTRIRAEQLGHKLDGRRRPEGTARRSRSWRPGPRVRGRGGLLRAAHPAQERRLRAALPDRGLHGPLRAARGPRVPGRGHGQGRASMARCCTPPRTATAPSMPSTPPSARRSGSSSRSSTSMRLVDYKVRIIDGESATAARTRVIIDSLDDRARVVHDGLRYEHHRGLRGGAGRLARVRHLEARRSPHGAPPTALGAEHRLPSRSES